MNLLLLFRLAMLLLNIVHFSMHESCHVIFDDSLYSSCVVLVPDHMSAVQWYSQLDVGLLP